MSVAGLRRAGDDAVPKSYLKRESILVQANAKADQALHPGPGRPSVRPAMACPGGSVLHRPDAVLRLPRRMSGPSSVARKACRLGHAICSARELIHYLLTGVKPANLAA